MIYSDFIASKFKARHAVEPIGLRDAGTLFNWQSRIVDQALSRNRAAIFAECGLGKTAMQLKFAEHVPGRVLILAPLAVGQQTEDEARKFGIENVEFSRDASDARIVVTNYENLHKFEGQCWSGIVLDESSILKGFQGRTSAHIIGFASTIPFRLACTATPAPNDWTELAMHSEFVGALNRNEMFARFFINDMKAPGSNKWRLKRHAKKAFWEWVRTWAAIAARPSDFGGNDADYELPKKIIRVHKTQSRNEDLGFLFAMPVSTLEERRASRKASVEDRCDLAMSLINNDPVVIWVGLNAEHDAICGRLSNQGVPFVAIKGADDAADKEERLRAFSSGSVNVIVTKPSIAGFGLNWQHCAHQVFIGIDDSFERYYQAIRRCWRFGQKRPVKIDIIISESEDPIVRNIIEKEEKHARLMGAY